LVLLLDDGKTAVTAHLIGGQNLSPERLSASLNVVPGQDPVMAQSITALTPSDLQITFPPLSQWCSASSSTSMRPGSKKKPAQEPCTQLAIWQKPDAWLKAAASDPARSDPAEEGAIGPTTYSAVYKSVVPAGGGGNNGAGDGFSFNTSVSNVATDNAHQGTVRIFLGVKNMQWRSVEIDAKEGDIISGAFTDAAANGGATVKPTNGVLRVTLPVRFSGAAGEALPAAAIDIALKNLIPGEILQLSATARDSNGKSTQPVTKSLLIKGAASTSSDKTAPAP
jgi:hypothetical protein